MLMFRGTWCRADRHKNTINLCSILLLSRSVNEVFAQPSVDWQLVTDVSGQPIGPKFKGQKLVAKRQ